MALIRGNWDIRFYVRDPEKAHPCAEPRVLAYFASKIDIVALAVASCKNQKNGKRKKINTFWCAKSRMRGKETPGRIVTNFYTGVGVHDVITSANFYDCRLWDLSVVEGQILGFSIDSRRRPYNTLALLCECVII